MILFRRNPFSQSGEEIAFVDGENLDQLLSRTLKENGLESVPAEFFQTVVEGKIVEQDMRPFVLVKQSDNILLVPKLGRGEGGQLFKTVATIAAIAAITYFTAGAGSAGAVSLFGGAGTAFAVGVAGSIAVSLALNALIPPPGIAVGGIGSEASSAEASQMYTITNQSNNLRKYGNVPKVYGRHRIFPNVVANPYTEVSADPYTGKLTQYFYAIYDFGLGPMEVRDIKIGNTPITDYREAVYRLVDLNHPGVAEGPWDFNLNNAFTLYKGDVTNEAVSVALTGDLDAGDPQSEYEVIRECAINTRGEAQEIVVDFVAPQGLTSFAANGAQGSVGVGLDIQFSKVGENVWRPFNDLTYVSDFQTTEGYFSTSDSYNTGMTVRPYLASNYDLISDYTNTAGYFEVSSQQFYDVRIRVYGHSPGTTSLILDPVDGPGAPGQVLRAYGNIVGNVTAVLSLGGGYYQYFLENPTTLPIAIYQSIEYVGLSPESIGTVNNPPINSIFTRHVVNVGAAYFVDNTTQPTYATMRFKPREVATYKVRIRRILTSTTYTTRVRKDVSFLNLSTRFDTQPIVTDKRHTFLEIRIRATDQLNGSIQNLSAVVSSVLDVYDENTQTWVKQETSNPAWVFADIMTGQINSRAIAKSRLDTTSLLEWAEYCDEVPTAPPSQSFSAPRFECNFVLDFDTTLQSLLNSITGAAQASLSIVDGKYGVLVDKLKTVPVQIFTPRNSWNFQSTRSYVDEPHALKIRYVDSVNTWDVAEAIVYADGYDEVTATEFDELSTFACTNYEQAWRFGRYNLAQAKLRRETIQIDVDFEHLVCTRGDYVQFTQDVMKVGGTPARVKTVVGNIITIDDGVETDGMLSYGYIYRGVSGIETDTLTVIDSDTFELNGPLPSPGDLIIIGEVGKIALDCIVKSISPNSDLSATLVLVEKADAIYEAESTDTIPPYSPNLNSNIDAAPGPITSLAVVANTFRVNGSSYEYYVGIDWDVPITGGAYDSYEVYVNNGDGYNLVDVTRETEYEYDVSLTKLGEIHGFKVLAVSATGVKIPLIEAPEVTATPVAKTTPPSNVLDLFINITGETLTLDWSEISDIDLREYFIRYSPLTTGAAWNSSLPLARVARDSNSLSLQGRTGTYLIKAVDLAGNESVTAAEARTTIPNLFDLNVIQEINDFTALAGSFDRVEKIGDSLVLREQVPGQYFSEGYYYFNNFLDLGEIYTARLQSLVQAEGYTYGDLMSSWTTLSSVAAMSSTLTSDWDLEVQYRATDSFNVMSDWVTLSSINPISQGAQDNWGPWRKFTITDATGRIFAFRFKLTSINPFATPRILDGLIKVDMPDRLESGNNITAGPTGYTVTFSPAFAGPGSTPNIQITQDDAESGDYFILENKTLEGFKITFYNSSDVAVTRQFDYAAKGYGRRALASI